MNFFELQKYTQEDIQFLIDNNQEENVHLDFKAAGALDKNPKKTDEISKDVSAFANSDGGIIVYGISEKDHKASSFSYIDGNEFTKEWLEQIISSKINRKIDDVLISPIRCDGDIEKTVYVVKIPRSVHAPHMSADKRYYKRYNFQSVMMEDYEVKDVISRKNVTKLDIDSIAITQNNDDDYVQLNIIPSICNVGTTIETLYKLNIYIDSPHLDKVAFSWDTRTDTLSYTRIPPERCKLSAMSQGALFSDEIIEIGRFSIKILKSEKNIFIRDSKVQLTLMYSSGIAEMDVELQNIEWKE